MNFTIVGLALILASCSSSKQMASSEYDDIYFNARKAEKESRVANETPEVIQSQTVVTPDQAMATEPVPQQQVYQSAGTSAVAEEELSDYEIYRMQLEAEMLGESYELEGSEAAYYDQYQYNDSVNASVQGATEAAPVIVNNYYYNDPNDYYYSSNIRRFSDEFYGWDYYDPYYTDLYWYTGRSINWGLNIGWGYPGWGFGFSYGYPSYSYGWGGSWGYPYYDY